MGSFPTFSVRAVIFFYIDVVRLQKSSQHMQRLVAVAIGRVHIGVIVKQKSHFVCVDLRHGVVERRAASFVCRIDISAGVE